MKIDVRHTYNCTPERFWEMYWDEAFDAALRQASAVQRELVEERTEGEVVVRRLRFTPERELPSAMAAMIGAPRLTYEQENRWDRPANTLFWKVIPTFLPGRFDAAGRFEIRPTPGGCEQVITGEVKVNVALVGGRIESAICSEIVESYAKTAAAGQEWLRARA